MSTLKWVVPTLIVLGVTLCLGALNAPKDAETTFPPGVSEKDWHALSDNFGFVLRVTKEPQFAVSRSINDGNSDLSSAAKEKIRKLLADRKKKLQELKNENATKEEINESLKDIDEELERLRKDNAAGLQKSRYYGVGEAQALFYARKDKMWYKVTTPPPPIKGHLLYK